MMNFTSGSDKGEQLDRNMLNFLTNLCLPSSRCMGRKCLFSLKTSRIIMRLIFLQSMALVTLFSMTIYRGQHLWFLPGL
nr:hypothetical protein Iba_chr09eCG7600 [Ipomoea batatas]